MNFPAEPDCFIESQPMAQIFYVLLSISTKPGTNRKKPMNGEQNMAQIEDFEK
jgi:hypothetical protein